MKKEYFWAIPVFGLIACVPVGYGLWTLTKTSESAGMIRTNYAVTYHYVDYDNGGQNRTRTISELELDGHFLTERLQAANYIFDGWKRSQTALSAQYPGDTMVSIRSLLEALETDGISPAESISSNQKTITIHLYDSWTVYSEEEGAVITVQNQAGDELYTFPTRGRSYLPVFVLAEADENRANLEYYQYSSAVLHYGEFGTSLSTNKFYNNDTLIMDRFPSEGFVLTAIYSS